MRGSEFLATAINVSRLRTLVIHARSSKTPRSTDIRPSIFNPRNFTVSNEDGFPWLLWGLIDIRSDVFVSKKKRHVTRIDMTIFVFRDDFIGTGPRASPCPFFPRGLLMANPHLLITSSLQRRNLYLFRPSNPDSLVQWVTKSPCTKSLHTYSFNPEELSVKQETFIHVRKQLTGWKSDFLNERPRKAIRKIKYQSLWLSLKDVDFG